MNSDKQKTDSESARNKAFGEQLKAIRKARGIKQDELAGLVNKSTETISKIERGKVFPGVDLLFQMARTFEISLDDLMDIGEEAKASPEKLRLSREAKALISTMDEEKLRVAVSQLEALVKL